MNFRDAIRKTLRRQDKAVQRERFQRKPAQRFVLANRAERRAAGFHPRRYADRPLLPRRPRRADGA